MNPWVAIVGRGAQGKAAAAHIAVATLRERGLRVGGFVTEPAPGGGYDLLDLASGQRAPLARTSRAPDICDLAFAPGIFERARGWTQRSDLDVVVAEVGKVEVRGGGHHATVAAALASTPPHAVVLCIRPDVLAAFALRQKDPVAWVTLPADEATVRAMANALADRLEARGSAGPPRPAGSRTAGRRG